MFPQTTRLLIAGVGEITEGILILVSGLGRGGGAPAVG